MKKNLLMGALALGIIGVAPSAYACATFYEHINYGGAHMRVGVGANSWIGRVWNDKVSSLRVDSGCHVTVHEHINFRGANTTYWQDTSWVGDFWNDRISSYVCTCN